MEEKIMRETSNVQREVGTLKAAMMQR